MYATRRPSLAFALFGSILLRIVNCQQAGTELSESRPSLSWQACTSSGICTTQNSSVVLDANWRPIHTIAGMTLCFNGNTWNPTYCPDPATCAQICAVDGVDYSSYGVSSSGNSISLQLINSGNNQEAGSRLFLMAPGSSTNYQAFNPNGQEFSFDVDASQLPCGVNGALYFAQMDADGGMAKYPSNKAGAKFGTGYCDSQCPKSLKFINGQANLVGWTPSASDPHSGAGQYGSCCTEMDVWNANSISSSFSAHPCSVSGQTRCTGSSCTTSYATNGTCDSDGCDFNPYRMGDTTFYGQGMTVDTKSKFTVVTQFITADNTTTGTLTAIRRLYVQNGHVIQNSLTNVTGVDPTNAISNTFCAQQKAAFNNTNTFASKGGMGSIQKAFQAGMVLVMSIWDDHDANMLWLDSDYPLTLPAASPGVARGSCAVTSGVPAYLEIIDLEPNPRVIFSNIKIGPIGVRFS